MFAAWGRLVHRFRWLVLALSFVLLVATGYIASRGGDLVGGGIIQTSESGRALAIMRDELPQASGSSFSLLFSSDTLRVTDPAFQREVEARMAALRADPRVRAVSTPYDATPPVARLISADGTRALVVVAVQDDINLAQDYYDEMRAKVPPGELEVVGTGNIAITRDFNKTLESDLQRAEIVSLPLALFLLLLVFATVVAALIPLGIGVLAVLGGIAGTFLLSQRMEVSQYALNVVTLIGLGVAIDYSLFVVNRFREELRKPGVSVEDAIALSMSTAGRAIAFSGLTVAIGLSGMLFYQGTFLSSMGLAGAVVVAFAVFYGLTFLPALLSVLGPRVNTWRVPIPQPGEGRGFWHGLSVWVMRRPVLVLVPVLVAILITASPFLRLEMANGDVTMLPKHVESRRGYDILVSEFPEYDKNQVTVVVRYAEGDPLGGDRIARLHAFHQRLAQQPDVLTVESPFGLNARTSGLINALCILPPGQASPQCPPGIDPTTGEISAAAYQQIYLPDARSQVPEPLRSAIENGLRQSVGERIVVFSVLTAQPKSSDEAKALVRAIRDMPPPAGAEVLVTGLTAFDIDVVEFILGRTPYAIAWVMVATYVVLFLLLGSVVLPLKAVVMNLLSIATSFGALVWIFQEGHLSEQLAFTPAPLDPTLPVILFCTVFGLSMDYEVLLLSRIQEEYVRTGDNARSVAEGLERSGRLITGAAAIMVGVFGAFALAEVVIIKAVGLGMALAVAIDATLVRALVVPATMRLLGRANWWAPAPLARLYRRLALGEARAGGLATVPVTTETP